MEKVYGIIVQNNPINRVDPLGLWYLDANITIGTPWFVGVTFGVMINDSGQYPYVGGGIVTPGLGASVTASTSNPTTGWNIGLQGAAGIAGQVGYGFGDKGGWYGELGLGGGYPTFIGGSLTGFYVFGPYFQKESKRPCK